MNKPSRVKVQGSSLTDYTSKKFRCMHVRTRFSKQPDLDPEDEDTFQDLPRLWGPRLAEKLSKTWPPTIPSCDNIHATRSYYTGSTVKLS